MPEPHCSDHQLSTTEIEAAVTSPAQFGVALRTLARLMVRAYRNGDPGANAPAQPASSRLTAAPDQSAHHGDEAP